MSIRTGIVITVVLVLAVAVAGFIVMSVQMNEAMPGIAKTAEAITNATLIATLRGGS